MTGTDETRKRLSVLQTRLDQINRIWSKANYEELLSFYVRILPAIMRVERCTIFVVDPTSERIWSKFGTGLSEHEIEAPREDSVVGRCISEGRCIVERQPEGFAVDSENRTGFHTRNLACAPIKSLGGYGITGAVEVLNRIGGEFGEDDCRLLEEVAGYLSMAMDNIRINEEILTISNRLNQEVEVYREQEGLSGNIVAESAAMRSVLEMARTLSKTPVSVFIHGENGTGKEVVARLIHQQSDRRERPFVAVNCASIPEALMESEFFGYEKGAFTGAVGAKPGRFEEASGGTLFLDEVADIPLHMQAKFLRALQEGEGMRLGSNRLRHYDLRVISATNKDLRKEVEEGRFREDLYYRLFSVEIVIPPLRERREEIVPLALSFLDDVSKRFNKQVSGFTREVLSLLESYSWPGNVRQLRREVERMVALTPEGARIEPESCSPELRETSSGARVDLSGGGTLPEKVRELEIAMIRQALDETGGNKVRASRMLGITRQGLDKKLKRYGLMGG
jgi:transcriptional regulator with PAS, ATPase and Fis domain